MASTLLVLWLLAQAGQAEGVHYQARLDVTGLALLPRPAEGYVQVAPGLVLDGGATWGLNVGAPLRLRVAGGPRTRRASEGCVPRIGTASRTSARCCGRCGWAAMPRRWRCGPGRWRTTPC